MRSRDPLSYCRTRTIKLVVDELGFIGTGTIISPTHLISCLHVVNGVPQAQLEKIGLSIEHVNDEYDLAILRTRENTGEHYVVADNEVCMNQRVGIYGFRRRDEGICDVVHTATVNSIVERRVSEDESGRRVRLASIREPGVIESGMSGGAVFDIDTLQLLGFIIGFEFLSKRGLDENYFVPLQEVLNWDPVPKKHVVTESGEREKLLSRVSGAFSKAGFITGIQRLGPQKLFNKTAVCARGRGKVYERYAVVIADGKSAASEHAVERLHRDFEAAVAARMTSGAKCFVSIPSTLSEGFPDLAYVLGEEDLTDLVGESSAAGQPKLSQHASKDDLRAGPVVQRARDLARSREDECVKLVLEACATNKTAVFLCSRHEKDSTLEALEERLTGAGAEEVDPALHAETESVRLFSVADGPSVAILGGEQSALLPRPEEALKTLGFLEGQFGEAAIVATFPGSAAECQGSISSFAKSQNVACVYLDLLPLSSEEMGGILRHTLGEDDGARLLKFALQSQEVFQFAQSLGGVFALIQHFELAGRQLTRMRPIRVLTALIDTSLSTLASSDDSLSKEDLYVLLVSLAAHLNEVQRNTLRDNDANAIVRESLQGTSKHQRLIAVDYRLLGVLGRDRSSGELQFERPFLLHYFLALGVVEAIERDDLSRRNPMFHRRLPLALLNDVFDLGIAAERLWQFIERTRGSDPEETGYIGGNTISLLRIANESLAKRDFSDMNLEGAVFAGTDVSNSDFSGTRLVDVGLANCNLERCIFADADLFKADLKSGCTIYEMCESQSGVFLATSQRRLVRVDHNQRDETRLVGLDGLNDSVFCVTVSPCGGFVGAGGQDGIAMVWNTETCDLLTVCRGHFSDVRGISFRGSNLVTGSVDGRVLFWDSEGNISRAIEPRAGEIWDLDLINGGLIAILSRENRLLLADLSSMQIVDDKALPTGSTNKFFYDKSRNEIYIGGSEAISVFSLERNDLRSFEVDGIRSFGGRVDIGILAGGIDGHINLISVQERTLDVIPIAKVAEDYVAAFSRTGESTWVVGCADGAVSVLSYNPPNRATICQLADLSLEYTGSVVGADFRCARRLKSARRRILETRGAVV